MSSVDSRIVYNSCRFLTDPPESLEWWEKQNENEMTSGLHIRYRRHYEIAVTNIDGSGTRRLTNNITLDGTPSWSPDGKRIAYVASPWDYFAWTGGHLYTIGADGSDKRLITPEIKTVAYFAPMWAPDADRIAFIAYEFDGDTRAAKYTPDWILYTVKADGTELVRIGEVLGLPFWSPDGSEIAVAASFGEEAGIYAVGHDGTERRMITPNVSYRVSWSPTGRELLLVGRELEVVYTVRWDGSGLRRILDNQGLMTSEKAVDAAWSPDGSRIAVLLFDSRTNVFTYEWGVRYSPQPYGDGSIVSIARDGSNPRTLVRWETERDYAPSRKLIAVNPDTRTVEEQCREGVAVPEPDINSGLVRDCEVLLDFKDAMDGGDLLNWGSHLSIEHWEGVRIGGSPVRVRELRLLFYRLRGTIPNTLSEQEGLHHLDLRGNILQGIRSTDFGNLVELKTLRLSQNDLDDETLAGLGELLNLEELSISYTRISRIPPELGNLINLRDLDLSSNNLSGSIPEELGNLVNLQELDLSSNDLSGSVPDELGNLMSLTLLDVSFNALTGIMPESLWELPNLQEINASFNEGLVSCLTERPGLSVDVARAENCPE